MIPIRNGEDRGRGPQLTDWLIGVACRRLCGQLLTGARSERTERRVSISRVTNGFLHGQRERKKEMKLLLLFQHDDGLWMVVVISEQIMGMSWMADCSLSHKQYHIQSSFQDLITCTVCAFQGLVQYIEKLYYFPPHAHIWNEHLVTCLHN